MKYKYLLFDADNTLLDFNASEMNALQLTIEELGLAFNDEVHKLYHKINDDLWKRLERGEIDRSFVKVERFRELFRQLDYPQVDFDKVAEMFMNNITTQAIPMDGALETLARLKEKYKIYIVTNGTASVQTYRLKMSGVKQYVDGVYMSQTVGYDKPRVEFFDHVVSDIGDDDLSKYIVIGDSLTSDIQGAKNKGIDACYVNYNKVAYDEYAPEYVVNSIEEVLCFLI